MENFSINYTKDIVIVKVDLPAATMRDAQFLWETLASDCLFDKEKLIVDLSTCSFIDSTFIGMIVKVFKRVNEKHGAMKLVFPQITDIESFRVIGITKILECFKSLDHAIESFNPDSSVSKIDIDEKSLYHLVADDRK
jgi:stage II sporulation protein AA (anti-sigma F factor antagonist)